MEYFYFIQNHSEAWVGIVFFLSLCVGSFLNVLIHRLPKMITREWHQECSLLLEQTPPELPTYNLFKPRSHCPYCNHLLKPWHNIPLLSYCYLRGKCAFCAAAISIRYPSVELICAIFSSVIAFYAGCTTAAMAGIFLTWVLLALTFIDLDTQLLPDDLVLPTLWLGLLLNLKEVFVPLPSAVIGAVIGYMSLWLMMWSFKLITNRQGMGHGDFKLFALLGAWFGWQALPTIILIASVLGTIVGIFYLLLQKKDYRTPLPFGPFLALGGWMWLCHLTIQW